MKEEIKEMSEIELFLLDLKCATEPTLTEKGKELLNKVEKEEKKWDELKQWVVDHPNYEINYYELLNKIDNLKEMIK